MRSHGWSGKPPADAAEARERILAATRTRLTAAGTTSISEIADDLGVTRQTVYRHFPTTEDLLDAASLDAANDLQEQLIAHVRRPPRRLRRRGRCRDRSRRVRL